MSPADSTPGRFSSDRVLAVVVSYCGGNKLDATVRALAPQVGQVLVVDNGSDPATLAVLRGLQAESLADVVELGANRGLGYALNVGAREALERGYDWMLTMDQDSVAAERMVRSMLDLAARTPGLSCVSPNIVLHGEAPKALRSGPVAYAITSGNLVQLDTWRRAGPFNEDYFIDCIDFDFSLRARARGHEIHKDPAALLYHELGQPVQMWAPFKRFYTQHSALRRYYMFRNFLFLARTHGAREPRFIGKLFLAHVLLLLLILAYEPARARNLRFIGRGIVDFLRGRGGPHADAANASSN